MIDGDGGAMSQAGGDGRSASPETKAATSTTESCDAAGGPESTTAPSRECALSLAVDTDCAPEVVFAAASPSASAGGPSSPARVLHLDEVGAHVVVAPRPLPRQERRGPWKYGGDELAGASFDDLRQVPFSRFALCVDRTGLVLAHHSQDAAAAREDEIVLPHSAIIDVLKVASVDLCTEEVTSRSGAAASGPGSPVPSLPPPPAPPHLLQVVCALPSYGSAELSATSSGQAAASTSCAEEVLMVTLSLQTLLDSMRVASALAHYHEVLGIADSAVRQPSLESAVLPPPPAHRPHKPLLAPEAWAAPVEQGEATAAGDPGANPDAEWSSGPAFAANCTSAPLLPPVSCSSPTAAAPPLLDLVGIDEQRAEVPVEARSPAHRSSPCSRLGTSLMPPQSPSRSCNPAEFPTRPPSPPPQPPPLSGGNPGPVGAMLPVSPNAVGVAAAKAAMEASAEEEMAMEVRREREAILAGGAPEPETEPEACDEELFGPLFIQVLPRAARNGGADAGGNAMAAVAAAAALGADAEQSYRPCCLRVTHQGLAVDGRALPKKDGQASGGAEPVPAPPPAWACPWVAVLDIAPVEAPAGVSRPPESHAYVVVLTLAAGCAACTLHVALGTDQEADKFVRVVREQRRLNGTTRGPPRNRAVQVSHLSNQQQAAKEAEPLTMVQLDGTTVPIPAAIASLLASCQAEDMEQPVPLNLGQVWLLVQPPSFRSFQLCSLCVDKLGLTLRPLVAADRLPEGCRKGAVPMEVDRGSSDQLALLTETLNFPITSVIDVIEGMEFTAALADCRGPKSPGTGANSAASPSPNGGGGAGIAGGDNSNSTTRRRAPAAPPFSRALLPQAAAFGQNGAGGSSSSSAAPPSPPTPHLVGIRVKGALAGRASHGAERVPAHMRLNAQPLPPVLLFMCFITKSEAQDFVAKILAFKKYLISVAVRTHVSSLAAVSRRELQRTGHRLGAAKDGDLAAQKQQDGPVAQRMVRQVNSPCVDPPPLPPRPADLPPASRLPRMVTNEEGEVFWYVPKKHVPSAPSGTATPGAVGGSVSAHGAPPSSSAPGPGGGMKIGGPIGPAPSAPKAPFLATPVPQPRGPKADEPPPDLSERGSPKAKVPTTPAAPTAPMDNVSPPPNQWVPPPRNVGGDTREGFEDADGLALFAAMDTPAPCLVAPLPRPGLGFSGSVGRIGDSHDVEYGAVRL